MHPPSGSAGASLQIEAAPPRKDTPDDVLSRLRTCVPHNRLLTSSLWLSQTHLVLTNFRSAFAKQKFLFARLRLCMCGARCRVVAGALLLRRGAHLWGPLLPGAQGGVGCSIAGLRRNIRGLHAGGLGREGPAAPSTTASLAHAEGGTAEYTEIGRSAVDGSGRVAARGIW